MQELIPIKLRATKPQQTNLALWSQALAVSPNCHLSTLALGLPLPGRRENLIQRLRRSLKNKRLSAQTCYQPLVKHLFEHWHGREVCLVMGVSVSHRGQEVEQVTTRLVFAEDNDPLHSVTKLRQDFYQRIAALLSRGSR